jgi:nanoRNase/pAp phosphatase (c-di-AMP/oligoRNAs hydrolase)
LITGLPLAASLLVKLLLLTTVPVGPASDHVRLASFVNESKHSSAAPGSVKVSARSKGRVRANALAHCFGGGGHPLASGFCVELPLGEAREAVIEEARRLVGSSPAMSDSA